METRPGSASPIVPSGLKLKSPPRNTGSLCSSGDFCRYARSMYGLSWKGLDFALTRYGERSGHLFTSTKGRSAPGNHAKLSPVLTSPPECDVSHGEFSIRRRADRNVPSSWGGPRDAVLETVGSYSVDMKIRFVQCGDEALTTLR